MTGPRGELRRDEPMSRHTSWRVGGPADRFFVPVDLDDLAAFLAGLPEDEPLHWVGLGSNLLVRDGGIRGTVVHTQGALSGLEQLDARRVSAGAGVACAKLARFCGRLGLAGAEFFAGIPGTLGGALAMNAGAFGGETWSVVESVQTVDRRGAVRLRTPSDYRTAYRSVEGPPGEWFAGATLRLNPGADPARLAEQVRELLARRAATQPMGQPSCGSVFRNPEGDHAARLIEAAGLKGMRIGCALISEKHANFILNAGGARAADIEALIELAQQRVEALHGVRLRPEVRIVGEARRDG